MNAITFADEFAIRTAPKGGYQNEQKAAYRAQVWEHLKAAKDYIQHDFDRVLIMPSSEGLEIDVALAHGIPPEHLLCVDRSAAVIATSKWRKKYPDIDFMACEISVAPCKAEQRGWRICAANLDLCGNFSEDMINTVADFWNGVRGAGPFLMGLTVAKGREGRATDLLLSHFNRQIFNEKRIGALTGIAGLDVTKIHDEGSYVGGKQPMAWAVFEAECKLLSIRKSNIEAAQAILRKIRSGELQDRFTARDVKRHQWAGLSDGAVVEQGLEMLAYTEKLLKVQTWTGGRPKFQYMVSPNNHPDISHNALAKAAAMFEAQSCVADAQSVMKMKKYLAEKYQGKIIRKRDIQQLGPSTFRRNLPLTLDALSKLAQLGVVSVIKPDREWIVLT
jgi:hypothetical protein